MCHTFFGMADGGALAFFSFADPDVYKLVIAEKPPVVGSFDHVAFKVSDRTYDEIVDRLKRAGETFRENDHGYCKSVYATSPDGLIVEFTVDPPGVEQIDAIRRADAHSELARWVAGDHRTNNDLRPALSGPRENRAASGPSLLRETGSSGAGNLDRCTSALRTTSSCSAGLPRRRSRRSVLSG